FFSRYDLLIHQPNTESGFSATLFQNKETKEYTLAIRGTKPSDTGDLKTDARMALGYIPQGQYNDMLSFYNQCKAKYPAMTESKSLNIVGHSLGGALTQMLALSICDDKNEANINEVYTFNSPGAKDLKPPYDLISNDRNIIYQKALQKAKDLLIREKNIEQIVSNAINKIDKILNNQYLGITFDFLQRDLDYIANINYVILDTDLVYFYKTLIKNYENRYAKDDKGNNYKLSISNRVFHIETDDDNNTENNQWQDELIQNLGKDIDGNHYYINIGIGLKGLEYVKVGKWFDSHSIIPLTQILYFYAYLLESNLIEEEEKSLSEYIAYCNTFNENIKTHTDTFMLKAINNSNMRNYNIKTMTSNPVFFTASLNHLYGDKPQDIDYLALFFSIIYAKAHKIEALKKDRNDYVIPAITKEKIIDAITELSNNGFYIKILEKEFFATIRKQCDFINDDKNIAYKSCIAAYQNFIIINKDNEPLETKDNLSSIYGYNSYVYRVATNEWEEIFLGASCKMIQGLYFNGKAKVVMLTS
ncbi:lipase family protein, partial [Helicobacter trogontum]|uniref:lipase family protein n=1 Tax=Helicobacter trogontum TaxID=50960 RepID=UPI001F3C5DEA